MLYSSTFSLMDSHMSFNRQGRLPLYTGCKWSFDIAVESRSRQSMSDSKTGGVFLVLRVVRNDEFRLGLSRLLSITRH